MEYTESIHDALYTLEYQLIPKYINNDGFIYLTSIESLFDGVSWDEMFEDDSWKDIDFQKIQVMHFSSYPLSYVVIKFPDPIEEPLAYYGMVVKWMGEYRYFTLEKGRGMNFLCEMTDKMHKNMGSYGGDTDMFGFSKYILDRFYPKPSMCSDEVEAIYQKGWEAHQDEDWAEAVKYYKEAAECGHTAAMESLGEFYIGGFGVKVDHEEGLMWLERAAEQGSADACFALGDYYFKGYGKEPNHLLAKDWLEKAFDLGSEAAKMIYERHFGQAIVI